MRDVIIQQPQHKKHYAYIKKSVLIKLFYVDLIVKCSNYRQIEYLNMKI